MDAGLRSLAAGTFLRAEAFALPPRAHPKASPGWPGRDAIHRASGDGCRSGVDERLRAVCRGIVAGVSPDSPALAGDLAALSGAAGRGSAKARPSRRVI